LDSFCGDVLYKGIYATFGDPVISFTVVLTGILMFSALGGYTSSQCNRASLKLIFILLLILLATLSLSQGFISQQILKAPFILRLTPSAFDTCADRVCHGISLPPRHALYVKQYGSARVCLVCKRMCLSTYFNYFRTNGNKFRYTYNPGMCDFRLLSCLSQQQKRLLSISNIYVCMHIYT